MTYPYKSKKQKGSKYEELLKKHPPEEGAEKAIQGYRRSLLGGAYDPDFRKGNRGRKSD